MHFYYALLRHVFPLIISLIHCCQIVILGLYLNQFAFKDVYSTDRPEILIDGFTPGLFIFMSASILFTLHMHILHSVLYTLPKILIGRISLTIKNLFNW